MKTSILTAISLALVTLLLVFVAAIVFMFQGRRALLQRVETVEGEATRVAQMLSQAESNLATAAAARDSAENTLAAVDSDNVLLEGQLVESQQTAEALGAELETVTAALQAATATLAQYERVQQEVLEQPPRIEIVSPPDGSVSRPGEPIEFILLAVDQGGVTAVNLTVNDETIGSYEAGDETLFTTQATWLPPGEGAFTASAMAVNANGLASEQVTITLRVIDTEARNAALRSQIENNVAELRGLSILEPITTTLLTRDQLKQRIAEEFAKENTPESTRRDALVLSAFDFLAPDYDLYHALVDLQGEAIQGFYDPETAEFVVVSNDDVLDVEEQWIHAHEVVHVLQDQHFQLDLLSNDSLDSEASAALRAFAEGEATLVQTLYLNADYFTEEQVTQLRTVIVEADTSALEGIPAVISDSFIFPYDAGAQFAFALYFQGGFEALDAAWENLPQSTEQILHPDRYRAGDLPQLVTVPPLTDTLGEGWEFVEEDVLGEFFLREYLGQQLDAEQVDLASTGWGGDRYAVYWNEAEQSAAMLLRIVWDTSVDGTEFAALYPNYPDGLLGVESARESDGGKCWQGEMAICLYHRGDESLIVRAPSLGTAAAMAAQVP
ncbi:MAG: Ig-like domain-containing protein [Anaerolineae bacterium]